MTAPTETEIREAIQAAVDDSSVDLGEWVYEILSPIQYTPPAARGGGYDDTEHLWDDLRPTQDARLAELREAIYSAVQADERKIVKRIQEMAVQAALTFAQEFPDAPRSAREPVTA